MTTGHAIFGIQYWVMARKICTKLNKTAKDKNLELKAMCILVITEIITIVACINYVVTVSDSSTLFDPDNYSALIACLLACLPDLLPIIFICEAFCRLSGIEGKLESKFLLSRREMVF